MTPSDFRRSLLAVAVATCSATAYGQQNCEQQISRIEREVQQQQVNQQRQTEIRELLRAARQNTGECESYVARAEQLMNRGAQTPTETAAQPSVEPTVSSEQQQTASQQPVQQRPVEPEQPSQGDSQQQERQVVRQEPRQQQQQAQPQDRTLDIQVDQAPAQVDVQTRSPQIVVKQQPAEITVEQKPPEVEITQREPEITVEQPQPNVQVNRAQPEVQVTQSEPEVEVRQSEPNVRIVQPEQATADVRTEQQGQPVAQQARQDQQQSGSGVSLQDVQGNQALSSRGEEIGDVKDFVRSTTDGTAHVLVAVGGVLGMGERSIAIPLERVRITREGDLQTQLTQQEVEQQEAYDEQRYEQIPQSEFAALEARLSSPQ